MDFGRGFAKRFPFWRLHGSNGGVKYGGVFLMKFKDVNRGKSQLFMFFG